MQEESEGFLRTGADGSQPFGFKMGWIVEGGGILEDQKDKKLKAMARVAVTRQLTLKR